MQRMSKLFLLGMVFLFFSSQSSVAEMDAEARAEIDSLKQQVQDLTKLLKEHIGTKQGVKKLKTSPKPVADRIVAEHRQMKKEIETLVDQQEATEKKLKKVKKDAWNMGNSSVHLAGYGSTGYASQQTRGSHFNLVQFSPILHYMYKDFVMLESEIEFEVQENGGTGVALEYLTIDLFLHDYVALVAGKFLSPLGQFRQNYHPTWINKLPSTPVGFGHDQAAPVSDLGLQFRGGFPGGGDVRFNYALYVANGPRLEFTAAGDRIARIEANGSTTEADGNMVYGGRFAMAPFHRMEIGLSGVAGRISMATPEPNRRYTAYAIDFRYAYKDLDLRAEYIRQRVSHAAASAAPASFDVYAWYLQAAYKLPYQFEIVTRYSDFHSPHKSEKQAQLAFGLNYLFASNVIAKLAYEANRARHTEFVNKDRYLIQLAFGF